jgi:hypothetical protein
MALKNNIQVKASSIQRQATNIKSDILQHSSTPTHKNPRRFSSWSVFTILDPVQAIKHTAPNCK